MNTRIAAAVLITMAMSGAVHAGKGPPADEAERAERMERMRAHLELSDEQVAEMQRIRAEGGGREDVREVLTDEQREKMDQMRERHRKQKHGRTSE